MISIQCAKLVSVSIKPGDTGSEKITGTYELVSNKGKVLAIQSFNGYNDVKLTLCPDTVQALGRALDMVQRDLEMLLGMHVEETK